MTKLKIIYEIMMLAGLSCPQTRMVNTSKLPWVKHDYEVLATAKVRCGQIYPGSMCVKMFRKKEFQNYWVICGQPVKKD